MGDENEDDQPRFYNHLVRRFSDLWNLPNEVIGWGLGYAGYGIGQAAHAMGLQENAPEIYRDPVRGMTNFIYNPLTPMGGLTVGHSTLYTGNPYDQSAGFWKGWDRYPGQLFDHEAAHVPQGRLLGPLYLPSNLIGGLYAQMKDGDWHGPSNWNERGPQMIPPQPWPRGVR